MDAYLVVFPSVKQMDYLNTMTLGDRVVYVVQQNNDEPPAKDANIIFVKKDDDVLIQSLQKESLYVLCCHEEALFWARLHASHRWNYPFSPFYFNLLEKPSFKQYVRDNNIPIGHYSLDAAEIRHFPVIAKPSIGFGSIGVRTLHDQTMLDDYVASFAQTIAASGIDAYQKKYFPGVTNQYIFETPIAGDFYRTPFIVNAETCQYIFPVRGVSKREKKNTDYNWVEFAYATQSTWHPNNAVTDMFNRLVHSFHLADGVYIAEFILADEKPMLLEFSPRQPSGRIGKMIYLATGIDLEIEAIRCFFKQSTATMPHKTITVRLRLQSATHSFVPLDDFTLIEQDSENSVHGEPIQCLYLIHNREA